MFLINCEINLILTWSKNCVISNAAANDNTTCSINDSKLYIPLVTSSTQDNAKLSQKLKSGFKRTINWNKYQSEQHAKYCQPIFRLFNWPMFLVSK